MLMRVVGLIMIIALLTVPAAVVLYFLTICLLCGWQWS